MAKRTMKAGSSDRKSTKKRTTSVRKSDPVLEATPYDTAPYREEQVSGQCCQGKQGKTIKYIIAAAILIIVGLLARQGLIIAAVVNGRPIFGWQVYSTMGEKFGKQTLEELVTQQLIADAAAKGGVSVSQEEVEARENEMIGNIGGDITIDELLSYQGITRKDFDNQVRMQLSVEKILANDISITEPDIDAFIASYSASLVATEEAAMREEARDALFEQKFGELVQPWFQNLKDQAKITRLF